MKHLNLKSARGESPLALIQNGAFEVSIWQWKATTPQNKKKAGASSTTGFDIERGRIRFRQWNRAYGTWDKTEIWCGLEDLRRLLVALGGLDLVGRGR